MTLPKIEYFGYLSAASGLGVAARGYLSVLKSIGYPLRCHDLTPSSHRSLQLPVECAETYWNQQGPVIRILHVNAEELPRILRVIPSESSENIYQIGIWAWETDSFPEQWLDRFSYLDEVWVGSQLMASAITAYSPVPVTIVPYVVEVPKSVVVKPKSDNILFTFFFSFDYRSIVERKNPLGLIEVFRTAFISGERVRLRIKSSHASSRPEYARQLQNAATGLPVEFMDEIVDTQTNWELLASADAYVSLHRSEGFGLGMAEAMALGKPVMATAYGGNCDYMNSDNSALVKYTLFKTLKAYPPYPMGTVWAETDHNDAIKQMRRLYEDVAWRQTIGRNAQAYMLNYYSPEAIASLISQRLSEIEKLGYPRSKGSSKKSAGIISRNIWKPLRSGWHFTLAILPERYHKYLFGLRRILGSKK
jgi:Glycosyltransferase